jgi:BirA family transcriptional regulator, biotin operon repressor / biotin---[acetyl-CoA-carboxylase] ligase
VIRTEPSDRGPSRISRLERFHRVGSTQDVVRGWLDEGEPEICVAVADEQTAGRGRLDRSWQAPPGAAILLSAGFRPGGLAAEQAWRLGAIVALAMLEGVEEILGDADRALALKWPNDLVARRGDGIVKVGGVLGESVMEDGRVSVAIVGIGVNADWAAEAFPPDLHGTMSSLREVVGGPVDRDRLIEAFLARVSSAYDELAAGAFPEVRWARRQVTTGADVELDLGGGQSEQGIAVGVDTETGGLSVRRADGTVGTHLSGDVVRCRLRVRGTSV